MTMVLDRLDNNFSARLVPSNRFRRSCDMAKLDALHRVKLDMV
jgi:hypothetical protein